MSSSETRAELRGPVGSPHVFNKAPTPTNFWPDSVPTPVALARLVWTRAKIVCDVKVTSVTILRIPVTEISSIFVDNVPENGIDRVVVMSGEASVAARTALSDRKVTHIRANPEIAAELPLNFIRFDPIVFLEYTMKSPFIRMAGLKILTMIEHALSSP